MKKILQLCLGVFLLVASLLLISQHQVAAAEEPSMVLIYVEAPETWEDLHVWTWNSNGDSAFANLGWPGKKMIADIQNPGWYYLYVPATMENVIINAHAGSVQTEAFPISGQNVWVTITETTVDDATIFVATTSTTKATAGDLPVYIPTKYVYAYVPIDWDTAGIWAWEHPAGINVFPSWPGQEMMLLSDGWFRVEIPQSANRVIINDMGSPAIQTVDIDVPTTDIYIVLTEANQDGKFDAELFDEKPIFLEDAFIVYITVPEGWTTPHVWAWSHPDGTNMFPSWPGEALTYDAEAEAYKLIVPNWVNRIIINNGIVGEGAQQTVDTILLENQTTYLQVGTAGDDGKYSTIVTYDEEPVDEEPVDEEPIDEEPTDEDEPENHTLVIVLVSVLGAAALGGSLYYFLKKRA